MYKIGEMVVVLPTTGRPTYVGEIRGLEKAMVFDTETGMHYEFHYLVNYDEFAENEIASTSEHLTIDGTEVVLTNIGLVDGEYQLTFDNEFTIFAEQLYCDEGGLHIYNGESEAETESDEDEFNLGFMLGYLDAVEDANEYINSDDDSLWDAIIYDMGMDNNDLSPLLTRHRNRLTEFYNRIIEVKNSSVADEKPELTLDEIREKLGYDFTLVD